jgi:hypothetical protein
MMSPRRPTATPLITPVISDFCRFSWVKRSKTTNVASSWGVSDVKLLYSFMMAPAVR